MRTTSRRSPGTTVSNVIRENSDGSLASYSLPSAGQREEYGLDAALQIGPFDLVAEYLNDRISPREVNNVSPLFATDHDKDKKSAVKATPEISPPA